MTALAVAFLAVVVAAVVVYERMSGVLRRRRHAPVVVTCKSGAAFKGTLAADDRRAVVLSGAETIDVESGKSVPVDGEVIVPWADVKYLQRL